MLSSLDFGFFAGGLVAIINLLTVVATHFINKKSAQAKALQFLMQDRLDAMCKNAIEKGSVSTDELKAIHKTHATYKALNGNGYFDAILPIVDELTVHN